MHEIHGVALWEVALELRLSPTQAEQLLVSVAACASRAGWRTSARLELRFPIFAASAIKKSRAGTPEASGACVEGRLL